ncbi:trypsin-like peptidase domain-containing protein [Agrobacterium tumefaciens]|uniref:trypsin-like peptidase domain-containing protein n=1 Tax=Agrobacterium tumefaciens TaxID=358 RepID=UPI001574E81F|nr:trypsin-like peptidase domain-containing protein [Agrobacterium tumefaciens]
MLNKLSLSVTRLRMSRVNDDGNCIASSIGTGFYWRSAEKTYLVTNYHNITGLNPDTNKLMHGWYPNNLQFSIYREGTSNGKISLAERLDVAISLYTDANTPVWIEHPLGRGIDCVAIKVSDDAKGLIHTNDYHFDARLNAYVGMDCTIIGYPKGLSADKDTPIWKRASIASEPFLSFEGKPIILVDTATREGMSGSPAVMRHSGLFSPDGGIANDSVIGTVENFMGIYSGRLADDPMGVQLGRIWKGHVIDEVINANKIGTHPDFVV